jgi:hypothetical protein
MRQVMRYDAIDGLGWCNPWDLLALLLPVLLLGWTMAAHAAPFAYVTIHLGGSV